jgi:hypothetical protein
MIKNSKKPYVLEHGVDMGVHYDACDTQTSNTIVFVLLFGLGLRRVTDRSSHVRTSHVHAFCGRAMRSMETVKW